MKRVIVMFLVLVCIAVLVFSCSKTKDSNNSPNFSFDKNGNYVGFSDLPLNCTIEEIKNDGYFVRQDLDTAANENVWDNFVQASFWKENASIRIVQFFTEGTNNPYFLDLFYRNGYYYIFDSSALKQEKQPFLYLLALKGKYGSPKKDTGVIVLTDDNTLTFDTVMKVLSSSSMEYIKSVSKFRIVMFK